MNTNGGFKLRRVALYRARFTNEYSVNLLYLHVGTMWFAERFYISTNYFLNNVFSRK
jgi:hypothetical protein